MTKTRRLLLVALMLALPIIASACVIDLGVAGCKIFVAEPGIADGLFCPI